MIRSFWGQKKFTKFANQPTFHSWVIKIEIKILISKYDGPMFEVVD